MNMRPRLSNNVWTLVDVPVPPPAQPAAQRDRNLLAILAKQVVAPSAIARTRVSIGVEKGPPIGMEKGPLLTGRSGSPGIRLSGPTTSRLLVHGEHVSAERLSSPE